MSTVICLHGCCQTADAFKSYLKSNVLDIGRKMGVTFHFLEGAYDHPDGGKTWTDPPLVVADIWTDGDGSGGQTSPATAVPKLEPDHGILGHTFSQIDDLITETGATVLCGFSQGAFVAVEYARFTRDTRIKKIVAMSGYTFRGGSDEQLDIEIMNVGHPFDPIVPVSLAFTNARRVVTMIHNNKELTEYDRAGHVVPSRKPQAREICEFITA